MLVKCVKFFCFEKNALENFIQFRGGKIPTFLIFISVIVWLFGACEALI